MIKQILTGVENPLDDLLTCIVGVIIMAVPFLVAAAVFFGGLFYIGSFFNSNSLALVVGWLGASAAVFLLSYLFGGTARKLRQVGRLLMSGYLPTKDETS